MEELRIFFDMDGVLADFDRGVRELCGREPLDQSSCTDVETDALWEAVSGVPHFYAKLLPIGGMPELVRALYNELGNRCRILTGIPKPKRHVENAGKDKEEWIRRFVSAEMQVHVVFREEKKQYCTGPQDILVDDYDKNIAEWEAGGGTGILFKDVRQTEEAIAKIREMLAKR